WALCCLWQPTSGEWGQSSTVGVGAKRSRGPFAPTSLDCAREERSRERQVTEAAKLAAAAGDGVEDQAGEETKHGDDDDAGDHDCGREARHQAGLHVGDDERDRE